MTNEYLNKMKELKLLKSEYDKRCKIVQVIDQFNEVSKELPNMLSKEKAQLFLTVQNEIDVEIENLFLESEKIINDYDQLSLMLNVGNLRNVVNELIKGEGMTDEQFAKEIGFDEEDILTLKRDAIVTMELLDAICNYFKIEKTDSFLRYVYPR